MSAAVRQTRDQRMASKALARVKEAAKDETFAKRYRSRAMSFPALVLQSGLAQAVGFLQAKSGGKVGGDEYGQYLDDLAHVAGKNHGRNLVDSAVSNGLGDYRLLTRDVLDAAGWLKRMTQAVMGREAEDVR